MTNKSFLKFLKSYIGKKIEVDFNKGGLIGSEVKGTLKSILGDFMRLEDCDCGNNVQFINIPQVNKIEIVDDQDE